MEIVAVSSKHSVIKNSANFQTFPIKDFRIAYKVFNIISYNCYPNRLTENYFIMKRVGVGLQFFCRIRLFSTL